MTRIERDFLRQQIDVHVRAHLKRHGVRLSGRPTRQPLRSHWMPVLRMPKRSRTPVY